MKSRAEIGLRVPFGGRELPEVSLSKHKLFLD
jgi:hypothetical protein